MHYCRSTAYLVLLAMFVVAASAVAAPTELAVGQEWTGISRNDAGKPADGVIVEQQAWAKAWQAINPNQDVPVIDFDKQLVIVATSDGPNRMFGKPMIDEQGNVTGRFGATERGGPGFGYMLLVVDRAGIKTYNGQAVPQAGAGKTQPYVHVEMQGQLETGIMAIGGETTGTIIKANNITFELDVPDAMRNDLEKLSNTLVRVKGELTVKMGVERGKRWIVKVKQLEAVKATDDEAAAAPDETAPTLVGDWTSSYEEKAKWDDADIFRPTGSKQFGPARFRMRYVFKADGTCQWLYLDPADAHRMVSGTWKTDPNDKSRILISNAAGDQQDVSFVIIKLTKDELQLKAIPKAER